MDWRQISKQLVEIHSAKSSAVILLGPHSIGEVVNLSDDDFSFEVAGKELPIKGVRRFLWENRKKRALRRKKALLWSAYIEDEDKSYLGVGALTSPRVAARMRGD